MAKQVETELEEPVSEQDLLKHKRDLSTLKKARKVVEEMKETLSEMAIDSRRYKRELYSCERVLFYIDPLLKFREGVVSYLKETLEEQKRAPRPKVERGSSLKKKLSKIDVKKEERKK